MSIILLSLCFCLDHVIVQNTHRTMNPQDPAIKVEMTIQNTINRNYVRARGLLFQLWLWTLLIVVIGATMQWYRISPVSQSSLSHLANLVVVGFRLVACDKTHTRCSGMAEARASQGRPPRSGDNAKNQGQRRPGPGPQQQGLTSINDNEGPAPISVHTHPNAARLSAKGSW